MTEKKKTLQGGQTPLSLATDLSFELNGSGRTVIDVVRSCVASSHIGAHHALSSFLCHFILKKDQWSHQAMQLKPLLLAAESGYILDRPSPDYGSFKDWQKVAGSHKQLVQSREDRNRHYPTALEFRISDKMIRASYGFRPSTCSRRGYPSRRSTGRPCRPVERSARHPTLERKELREQLRGCLLACCDFADASDALAHMRYMLARNVRPKLLVEHVGRMSRQGVPFADAVGDYLDAHLAQLEFDRVDIFFRRAAAPLLSSWE